MNPNTCPWIVAIPSGNPEPTSEADLWEEVECGADVTTVTDGWECTAGHEYHTYGSATQQAYEFEEAMTER